MEKDFYVPFVGFPNARVISNHFIAFVRLCPPSPPPSYLDYSRE